MTTPIDEAAKAMAKAMNVDAIHPDIRKALPAVIAAANAAVLRGSEAGETADMLRIWAQNLARRDGHPALPHDLEMFAAFISAQAIALAEERGKVPERSKYVETATVRDGGDTWHIECRFKDGQKYAAVTVEYEWEGLADEIAAWLSALPAPSTAPLAETEGK